MFYYSEVMLPELCLNSVKALKGEHGKDCNILAPVGITVTTDDGRVIGRTFCLFIISRTVLLLKFYNDKM